MHIYDHQPNAFALWLAQQDGGPNLGGGPGNTETTGATDGGGAGGSPSLFGGSFLPLILMMFVVIIIWSVMGQRREKKKRERLLGSITKHDRVQTVGGIIGSVVDLRKDTVVLKVDESTNTRMTFARSSIQQVLTERSDSENESTESES